jgi:hypothetical protein
MTNTIKRLFQVKAKMTILYDAIKRVQTDIEYLADKLYNMDTTHESPLSTIIKLNDYYDDKKALLMLFEEVDNEAKMLCELEELGMDVTL